MFEAVIFDFDGLIVDTETPLYEAWSETFVEFGVEPISITEWADSLGRGDDDPELLDPSARLHEACGGSRPDQASDTKASVASSAQPGPRTSIGTDNAALGERSNSVTTASKVPSSRSA